MKRPKNFLLLAVLLTVVAIALAAAFHVTRHPNPAVVTGATAGMDSKLASPRPVSNDTPTLGTPSAAAQQRAKDFNDATNRFNAPDSQ